MKKTRYKEYAQFIFDLCQSFGFLLILSRKLWPSVLLILPFHSEFMKFVERHELGEVKGANVALFSKPNYDLMLDLIKAWFESREPDIQEIPDCAKVLITLSPDNLELRVSLSKSAPQKLQEEFVEVFCKFQTNP